MKKNKKGRGKGSRNGRGSGFRGSSRSGFGGGRFGQRRSFQPREMHKAVCDKCKKKCEVPFKPTEGRPVYCKECFAGMRDN